MSTLGIISEYNPYHNGHAYLLETAKSKTGAHHSVSVMSGCFSQQGLPMSQDKYLRARAAAASGIDLVFELPVLFATGSAGDFAEGAVALLTRSSLVDYLCFGVETPEEHIFSEAADCIMEEPARYRETLKEKQKEGFSFPAAREHALAAVLGESVRSFACQPNNILALEYILAIKRLKSPLKTCFIQRTNDYHGRKEMGPGAGFLSSKAPFLSATDIRRHLLYDENFPLQEVLPEGSCRTFREEGSHFLLSANGLMPYIASKLLELPEELSSEDLPMGMTMEMFHRLKKQSLPADYETVVGNLKKKNITHSRVTRSLLHLVLGIRESDQIRNIADKAKYLNLLSAREESTGLLRDSALPLIIKKSAFQPDTPEAERMWLIDRKAASLYSQLFYDAHGIVLPPELRRTPVIVPASGSLS